MTALAKRAVACKGWRWMTGMRNAYIAGTCVQGEDPGDREDGETPLVRWTSGHWKCTDYVEVDPDHYPDIDDPATLGCLLALVRESWGDPEHQQRWVFVCPCVRAGGFVVRMRTTVMGHPVLRPLPGKAFDEPMGDTEAEALVSALEAAP